MDTRPTQCNPNIDNGKKWKIYEKSELEGPFRHGFKNNSRFKLHISIQICKARFTTSTNLLTPQTLNLN